MAIATPSHNLTEAQYLELERRADFNSEFFGGEMFANMAFPMPPVRG